MAAMVDTAANQGAVIRAPAVDIASQVTEAVGVTAALAEATVAVETVVAVAAEAIGVVGITAVVAEATEGVEAAVAVEAVAEGTPQAVTAVEAAGKDFFLLQRRFGAIWGSSPDAPNPALCLFWGASGLSETQIARALPF